MEFYNHIADKQCYGVIWHNLVVRANANGRLDFYKKPCYTKIGHMSRVLELSSYAIAQAYFAENFSVPAKSFTPDSDKSYAENQAAWVKFHGLEIGSKVKVVRAYGSEEGGCRAQKATNSWIARVGKHAEITSFEGKHIQAMHPKTGDRCFHPYFALEPVS